MLKFVYLGCELCSFVQFSVSISIGISIGIGIGIQLKIHTPNIYKKFRTQFSDLWGIKSIREHSTFHRVQLICRLWVWVSSSEGFCEANCFSHLSTETVMWAYFLFHSSLAFSIVRLPSFRFRECCISIRNGVLKVAKCSWKWHRQPEKSMRFIMMKSVNVLAHKNFFSTYQSDNIECPHFQRWQWNVLM